MPNIVIAGTGQPEIFPILDDINSACDVPSERFNVVGYIDDNPLNASKSLRNCRVLGPFDWIVGRDVLVINTIGRTCEIREQSTFRLLSLGARFVNIIHPSVSLRYIDRIGNGNIISAGTRLEPGSSIGDHNMFLSGVVLGHGVTVGSFTFLGHNVICNGEVKIEDNVFVGSGSQLLPGIKLIKGCKLCPGTVLTSDANRSCQYLGNPGRRVPGT
jgi:acetyltransferase-like isoleucine patch superfamily enzyme